MPEPADERVVAAGSPGHLRASRTDRERVIERLKDAFVEDRLTQDELDTRVGLALAARTYAELADLTTDIPVAPAAAEPAGTPDRPARTLALAAGRSGACILVALAVTGLIALTNAESLAGLAFMCWSAALVAASGFLGYGVIDAWQQRRSGGQLPPRTGQGGQAPQVQQPGRVGHDPAQPPDRPNQVYADSRSDRSRPGRPHSSGRHTRTPRGIRLVPDAA